MDVVLADAGRAALKAILASLLVLAPGIAEAPDLNRAVALGIAAVVALLAAAAAAVQVYVPLLSFRAWVSGVPGAMLDSFVHGFLAAFLTSIIGILNMPDLSAWKSLVVGAVVGAINAGLRGLQSATSPSEHVHADQLATARAAPSRPKLVILPA